MTFRLAAYLPIASSSLLIAACDRSEQASEARPLQAAQTGQLPKLDCSHAGTPAAGGVHFIPGCPLVSTSPDREWTVEQTAAIGSEDSYRVLLKDGSGRTVGEVPGLVDTMPFVLYWPPRSGWFFVDHWVGSGMSEVELYEATGNRVVRHNDFMLHARQEARRRYPCLPDADGDWLNGIVRGWSADGRRLAWSTLTRVDVCMGPQEYGAVPAGKQVDSLLLVSDVDSGAVIEGSVVVMDDAMWKDFRFPDSEPYRGIRTPN